MSPRSSIEQTAGRMNLLLSITTNQIVTCSNGAGSVFFFPGADFKQRVQKCCLMWCDCVLERLSLKTYLQRKALGWRSWQMLGMFLKFNQPELWLLTANVNLKRHLSGPSVM